MRRMPRARSDRAIEAHADAWRTATLARAVTRERGGMFELSRGA
jgi:hypothetical protein